MDDQPFHVEIPGFGEPAGKPERDGSGSLSCATVEGGSEGSSRPQPAPDGPNPSPEPALTDAEVRDLRTLLTLLGPGWVRRVAGAEGGPGNEIQASRLDQRRGDRPVAPTAGSNGDATPPLERNGTTGLTPAAETLPDFPPTAVQTPDLPGGRGGSRTAPTVPPPAMQAPTTQTTPMPAPATKAGIKAGLMQLWSRFPVRAPEQEAGEILRRILEEIAEEPHFARIFTATAGVFPIQHALRHHTPDQALAVFGAITDRFLLTLAGIDFEQRRKLLRAVAKYASDLAGFHTFIPYSRCTLNLSMDLSE